MKTNKEFIEKIDSTENISVLKKLYKQYFDTEESTTARLQEIDVALRSLEAERHSLYQANTYGMSVPYLILEKVGRITLGVKDE